MMKIIENKKTGVKGYIVSEGEKVKVNINGQDKEYTIGSFKKMFKIVEEVVKVEEEKDIKELFSYIHGDYISFYKAFKSFLSYNKIKNFQYAFNWVF